MRLATVGVRLQQCPERLQCKIGETMEMEGRERERGGDGDGDDDSVQIVRAEAQRSGGLAADVRNSPFEFDRPWNLQRL